LLELYGVRLRCGKEYPEPIRSLTNFLHLAENVRTIIEPLFLMPEGQIRSTIKIFESARWALELSPMLWNEGLWRKKVLFQRPCFDDRLRELHATIAAS
jgi:hypothetical protein